MILQRFFLEFFIVNVYPTCIERGTDDQHSPSIISTIHRNTSDKHLALSRSRSNTRADIEKMSNISGAKDKESLMMVKLRRLFLQEPDKMKELKLLLRHHLPSEILQPEKEFPDIFDALTFQSKIALGEYSFLCDIFSEICFEAEKITREYQAIIINLLEIDWVLKDPTDFPSEDVFPEDEVTTKEELEQVVPIAEKLGAKTTTTDTTGLDESLDVLVK
ncbi:unnamed protein product [Mytilus edulis]|uniref:Uncharacterized protein n=1 Tax=Mytilus edulis TaxID=6550 RepID=A0A8S3PPD5_MYTED|nr:unnamed protein product [Mytilus edulis]